jgi:hypothetical protein
VRYLPFLSSVHELVAPERYLEIGVRNGNSLALARCPSVGIDPAYSITAELDGDVSLVRTTSDEYFSRPEQAEVADSDRFDLAFVDGLHLFEFALRDFVNAERRSRRTSVILFDDVLPRTAGEAARERHTLAWTGDVFHVVTTLERYRPDVSTILVDTEPTGLFLVVGLDPESTVLPDRYDDIMAAHRQPDPQPVPLELLDRDVVQAPERVLEAGFWKVLREERADPGRDGFSDRLREQLARDFGPRYAR